MRDQRFVAVHRGGPLSAADHRRLAAWAAECAARLLARYAAGLADDRPRRAVRTARSWVRGEVAVGDCQKAALAAHAAAREATDARVVFTARAAGHAVATAHAADHCLGVVIYGRKAVAAAGGNPDAEVARQLARLPDDLRPLVVSALRRRDARR